MHRPGEQGPDGSKKHHIPFGKIRRERVWTFSTPASPDGRLAMGTDAIEVNSPPRSSGK